MERLKAEAHVAALIESGAKIIDRAGAVEYFMKTMPDTPAAPAPIVAAAPAVKKSIAQAQAPAKVTAFADPVEVSKLPEPEPTSAKAEQPAEPAAEILEGWEMLLIQRLTSVKLWGGLAVVWGAWHVAVQVWRRLFLPVLFGIEDFFRGLFKGAIIGGTQAGIAIVFVGVAVALYRAFSAWAHYQKSAAHNIPSDLVFAPGNVTASESLAATNTPITFIINAANGSVSLSAPQNDYQPKP